MIGNYQPTLDPSNVLAMNQIYAEVVRLCINMDMPQEFASNLDIQAERDYLTQSVAYRIVMTMAGMEVCKGTESTEKESETTVTGTFEYPATWCDAFKLAAYKADLPRWIAKTMEFFSSGSAGRFWQWRQNATISNVKYEKVDITKVTEKIINKVTKQYHVCPFPAKLTDQGRMLRFMQWGEAYEGTAEEYHALVKIAEAAKQNSGGMGYGGYPSPDLLRALHEYEHGKASRPSGPRIY